MLYKPQQSNAAPLHRQELRIVVAPLELLSRGYTENFYDQPLELYLFFQ
jgi:hypothetical protein